MYFCLSFMNSYINKLNVRVFVLYGTDIPSSGCDENLVNFCGPPQSLSNTERSTASSLYLVHLYI